MGCCDSASPSKFMDRFGNKGRTGRCLILDDPNAVTYGKGKTRQKCKDIYSIPRHDWSLRLFITEQVDWANGRPFRHFSNTESGRRMILGEDMKKFTNFYGSRGDYCQGIQDGNITIGPAHINHGSRIKCPEGYAHPLDPLGCGIEFKLQCTYDTPTRGKFVPTPECVKRYEPRNGWIAGDPCPLFIGRT